MLQEKKGIGREKVGKRRAIQGCSNFGVVSDVFLLVNLHLKDE